MEEEKILLSFMRRKTSDISEGFTRQVRHPA